MPPSRKQIRDFADAHSHTYSIHEFCVDVPGRQIFLHGKHLPYGADYQGDEPGVEYMMATQFIKNLHTLRLQSPTEPVTIHLHTCGGLYPEGMAVYDAIRAMPYNVTIISYTHARSMSSLILQAGDRRLLMASSYFMFHYGTYYMAGEFRKVESNFDFDKQNDRMIDIYVEALKRKGKFKDRSERSIRTMLKKKMDSKIDVFLTAKEAVEWGFADGIVAGWGQDGGIILAN